MSSTRQRRDIGTRNLSTATRWVAAGAVGLAGLFSAAAVHAFPGHTRSATVPAGGAAATPQAPHAASGSSLGVSGLRPPSRPPTRSTSAPYVVSGAS